MKKILLIAALFISLTSHSQELDTMIIKNNNTYRFEKTGFLDDVVLKNETTRKARSLLPKGSATRKEIEAEAGRIKAYMRDGETNMAKCLLTIYKETFKDCALQDFKHSGSMLFTFSVGANGDIIHIEFVLEKGFLDVVGYDKSIEFEEKIRKNYKFPPFLNPNVSSSQIFPFAVMVKKDQLDEAFK